MNCPTSSPSLLLVLPASATSISKRFASSWTVLVILAVLTTTAHLAETTSSTIYEWDWTGGRNHIDIVEELASIRHNLTGVDIAPGPFSLSPAIYFTGDNRNIRLLDTSYHKVMTLLQSHHDITFVAAVRQEPYNVGTLFSLSEGFTRFLELQSSGRKDEIRLHYTHLGNPRVETFNHRLADGVWHRLAVTVSGGIASLYIDCRRVERRWMAAIPDTSVPESAEEEQSDFSKMSLWVGQRGDQHFPFKGAMQDVKLIAGSNGHLVQCPSAEAECPTCGEFHGLRSVVARLEKSLQQLTNKLEDAEERISQLEQCDCPRSCSVNGTVHADGSSWHSDCEVCSCHKGQVTCSPVQCPATPCRNPVLLPGQCCKTCLKQCFFRGTIHDHGDVVRPRQCLECGCHNGSMQCQPLDPERICPVLSCPPSEQFTVAGECCKQCHGVDYCATTGKHVCHERAQCINLQTTFACHCSAGYTGDGKHCYEIDECTPDDGLLDGHRCGDNMDCIKKDGAYRCLCKEGFHQINGTCVDIDECAAGASQCHPVLAVCNNTEGSFECKCHKGYRGDGTQCEPVCGRPCQNGGRCVAPDQCSCRRGFHGVHCELDVDECVSSHQCHPNSECHNMPGWYACICKPGFRAPQKDAFLGALCQDIDECAEGTHSCHGNTQCLNTMGSYECRCPPSNPNCSLVCTTEEGVHQNGETWTSYDSPCVSCQCREGVVTCSKLPCDCSSSSSGLDFTAKSDGIASPRNQTAVRHPNSEQCCPRCLSSQSVCRHQENSSLTYQSGEQWIYQCQRCECLHGETDCWPMECPPVYCKNPIQGRDDCCPRCPEDDPCSAIDEPVGLLSSEEPLGCHHKGFNFTHGAEWVASLDGCTHCKCKKGKVCCKYDTQCAELRLVVDPELAAKHHQNNVRNTSRFNRSSPEGFPPATNTNSGKKKSPSAIRMGAKASATTAEVAPRSSRSAAGHQKGRPSRAARLGRSGQDHSVKKRQSVPPNSSPSSATRHVSASSHVPAVSRPGTRKVVSQLESGPT